MESKKTRSKKSKKSIEQSKFSQELFFGIPTATENSFSSVSSNQMTTHGPRENLQTPDIQENNHSDMNKTSDTRNAVDPIDTIDTVDTVKTNLNKRQKNKLTSRWTLYFHSAECDEWQNLISYPEQCHVRTLEQFFELYYVLSTSASRTAENNRITTTVIGTNEEEKLTTNAMKFAHGMFFFMREGHPPIWESSSHCHGGYWSLKVSFEHALSAFYCLASQMICETLLDVPNFPSQEVIGISYSPKRFHGIFKILVSRVPPTENTNNEARKSPTNSQTKFVQTKVPFTRGDAPIPGITSLMTNFTKFENKSSYSKKHSDV